MTPTTDLDEARTRAHIDRMLNGIIRDGSTSHNYTTNITITKVRKPGGVHKGKTPYEFLRGKLL